MNEEPVSRAEFEDLKSSLARIQASADENTHILHTMQFWGRVAFVAKILIWAGVLTLPFIIYHFLSPTLSPAFSSFMTVFGSGSHTATTTSVGTFTYPTPAEVMQYVQSHK